MQTYFPPAAGTWDAVSAKDAGMSEGGVVNAVRFAQDNESSMDRDVGRALASGHFSEPMPDGEIIGPTKPRGDPSGLILSGGRIVAEWGPTDATDMTFSVAKSYLAICTGLAVGEGLITDLDQRVGATVDDLFDTPQNESITWRHLLQLTSEWEGTLWGKADRIDRNRQLTVAPNTPSLKGTHRDLQKPGHFWEYNDVRVNVLAYSLMRLFRRPLPDVLREKVMRPIGASQDWQWHGYENSTVEIDGTPMQSVTGGAHWGGGLFISTRDHARIGLLMANDGLWEGNRILPEGWVEACTTPCPLNPDYGLLWWLNRNGAQAASATRSSYFALGVGRNLIWIDPDHDLVSVVRWIDRDSLDGFVSQLAL